MQWGCIMQEPFSLNPAIPLIIDFGYSFAIGMALGWGLRKAFKWIVIIVGLMMAFTLVYQFFGGGDSSVGLDQHYSSVAPVFEHSLRIITDFLGNHIVRLGGFGIGFFSGLSYGK